MKKNLLKKLSMQHLTATTNKQTTTEIILLPLSTISRQQVASITVLK